MKTYIVKVHKHSDSTRLTIPKELIKAMKWEKEEYISIRDEGAGTVILSSVYPTENNSPSKENLLANLCNHPAGFHCKHCRPEESNNEQLSTNKA